MRPADEGGFWAEVLELEGCLTQGETEQELLENVIEATHACIEAGTPYDETGAPRPEVWNIPLALPT